MAKTHRPLTFDELCEEAFGSGLHPWEFYTYDLSEFMLRRKGIAKDQRYRYQEQLIACSVPYMDKQSRSKIFKEAFKEDASSQTSLTERYNQLLSKYEGITLEDGRRKRNKNNNRG